jgi:glycosyltransferase involved in cell wall biosynthesis
MIDETSERSAKRQRVLVVGQGYPTLGGVPTFIDRLINDRWLTERVQFDYLNTTPKGVKRPAAFHLSNLWFALRDGLALFGRARGKEVVHLNLAPAPVLPLIRALVLCAAAKMAGARVILHAHSGRLERSVDRPVYRLILRVVLRLVDSFVVVSKTGHDAVGGLSSKTSYIPNGIDARLVPTGPKANDLPTLAFVGTVCERKGLLDLRDALLVLQSNGIRLNENLRVLIVGDAKQEGPGVYERIVQQYAEADLGAVEFTGSIQRNNLLELLGKVHIFCLPSYWEGFPLSLLEAMAAETAIVATTVGEIPAILENGNTGILVEPRDPHGLAAAIARLVKDPQLRQGLGRAARDRVESEYGHDKTAAALQALYRELADYSK